MRANLVTVFFEACELVIDDMKPLGGHVMATGLADQGPELILGVVGHRTPSMRNDQDSLDSEQVHCHDERFERSCSYPSPGIAKDLGVSRLETEYL